MVISLSKLIPVFYTCIYMPAPSACMSSILFVAFNRGTITRTQATILLLIPRASFFLFLPLTTLHVFARILPLGLAALLLHLFSFFFFFFFSLLSPVSGDVGAGV